FLSPGVWGGMMRPNRSRWEEWVDGPGDPPGVRSSGVRERRPPASEEAPCASFEEAYARFRERIYHRALWMLGGDASAAQDVSQQVFMTLDRRIREEKKRVPHPLKPVLAGL